MRKRQIRNPLYAIRLKCLECNGDNRDEVIKCPIDECPLYNFRLGNTDDNKSTNSDKVQDDKQSV